MPDATETGVGHQGCVLCGADQGLSVLGREAGTPGAVRLHCAACGEYVAELDGAGLGPIGGRGLAVARALIRNAREAGEPAPRFSRSVWEKLASGRPIYRVVKGIVEAEDGTPMQVRADIPLEEVKALRSFQREATAARSSRWVREGFQGIRMKVDFGCGTARVKPDGKGIEVTLDAPPTFDVQPVEWEDVQALLHRLRPLILQGESTYLPRITNILSHRFGNERIREFLTSVRDEFLGRALEKFMIVESSSGRISSEETLQKWLNAQEFHRDTEKQEEIEDLLAGIPRAAAQGIFLQLLSCKLRAITQLDGFIGSALRQKECMSVGV